MPSRTKLRTAALKPTEVDILGRQLSVRGQNRRDLAADLMDGITAMAIRFTDPISLSMPMADNGEASAIQAMVCRIEEIAEANGIEYVKIMGDLVMCATGFQESGITHTQRAAEAALAVQEVLLASFAALNAKMAFQIGIDSGTAVGSTVGCGQGSYNLWGHAVQGALQMAHTGVPGGIQLTESAYSCLQAHYLFKIRGAYYVDKVGEMRTYLLTGRL